MSLHDWNLSPSAAVALQRDLEDRVRTNLSFPLRLPAVVAGVDVSFTRRSSQLFAAVVVLRLPDFALLETQTAQIIVNFPYVPGLLSFREVPPILAACAKLRTRPHLVMCDGQGRAHPRRFGLACHLGLWLGIPTVGCAKSLLVGEIAPLEEPAGSTAPLLHRGEEIGRAVRTKRKTKPVFVSAGHLVNLPDAVAWTLACTQRHRLPEPTRLAHAAVNTYRRQNAAIPATP